MNTCIRCLALALLLMLGACGDKKEKYLAEFQDLVGKAQFHPEVKKEGDWEDIVKERAEFLRGKFVDVHPQLTERELYVIDSLDNVLKQTVLRYTKKQKIFEELTKQ